MCRIRNVKRRGAIYWLRVRVPADVKDQIGRAELARSLRTSNPADARRLSLAAGTHAHRIFDTVRNMPSLTRDQITALVREFHEDELDRARLTDTLAPHSALAQTHKELADRTRPALKRDLADALTTSDGEHLTALIGWAADDVVAKHGLEVVKGSPAYVDLCRSLARAWLDVQVSADAQTVSSNPVKTLSSNPQSSVELVPAPLPAAPALPAASTTARALSPDAYKPLSVLLPEFLRKRGYAERTVKELHVAVRMVEDFFGEPRALYTITKPDMIAYRRFLEDAPTNAQQRFPGKSLREAVELNRKRAQPFETMGPRVINDKWLAHLKSLLSWCVSNCFIPDNPASGVKVETSRTAAKKESRDPFSPAQLKAIFNAPLFTGPKAARDARFWAPAISLFTGMRPGELAQVEIADMIERDGILCINVTEQTDSDDPAASKSLKTANAKRLIPVHAELLRLGFREMYEKGKAAGYRRLLDDWKPDAKGDYIATLPRWFNRTFLPSIKAKTDRTVFYSFRHSFRDAMRQAGINPEVQNALFGHSDQTTAAIYGHGARVIPVKILADAMEKVRYPDLSLSRHYTQ